MPALNSLAIAVLALFTVACRSEQLPSAAAAAAASEPSVSVEDARRFSVAIATWTPADTTGEAHEHELWLEFREEAASKDHRRWLYNGGDPARGARPPDLAYWMGYRIAKAYYDQAADKRAAIREMLTIRDFEAFLRTSKYAGGKQG